MKKADKFDHFRVRTRRAFAATLLGSAMACGAAFFGGLRMGAQSNAQEVGPSTADWLLALTRGPLAELEAGALHLARALPGCTAEDPLWLGYHRLVAVALQQKADTPLRRQLIEVATADAPLAAREAAEQLRAKGR